MTHLLTTGCLVLACGNTLRSDDGVGPWLAAWLEACCPQRAGLRILSRQQWTADLAEDLAQARAALFLDCSIAAAPGELRLQTVTPAASPNGAGTHHLGAAELLALALELYGAAPAPALLFTLGAGSLELSESFSPALTAALPEAQARILKAIDALLPA